MAFPVIPDLYVLLRECRQRKKGGTGVWRTEGLDNMIQKATFAKTSDKEVAKYTF